MTTTLIQLLCKTTPAMLEGCPRRDGSKLFVGDVPVLPDNIIYCDGENTLVVRTQIIAEFEADAYWQDGDKVYIEATDGRKVVLGVPKTSDLVLLTQPVQAGAAQPVEAAPAADDLGGDAGGFDMGGSDALEDDLLGGDDTLSGGDALGDDLLGGGDDPLGGDDTGFDLGGDTSPATDPNGDEESLDLSWAD